MTPKRVFIADDEPEFRAWMRRISERNGWVVTECHDGMELIAALERFQEDGVVFLDVMMPEMDGIEVVGRIAEMTDNRPIHFITGGPAVTCLAARLLAEQRGLNICDVFTKPISLDQVSGVLRAHT